MSDPYIGEIKMISFNFPPKGWAFCSGQLLPINQNQALFSILGTTYGGDGITTFALPDMRGRIPLHFGNGFAQGQRSGEEAHILSIAELPNHNHTVAASTAAPNVGSPSGAYWAAQPGAYDPTTNVQMAAGTMGNAGGSQPHNNMAPYLTINFIIAVQGIFPSRN